MKADTRRDIRSAMLPLLLLLATVPLYKQFETSSERPNSEVRVVLRIVAKKFGVLNIWGVAQQ